LLTKALLTHDEIVLLYAVPLELKQGTCECSWITVIKAAILDLDRTN
jgi:hypothetical protein